MNILIPTDFSSCANHASNFAINLAQLFGARITYVHLMSIPIDWTHLEKDQTKKMYPDVTQKVNEANTKLQELRDRAEQEGVDAEFYVHYNESLEFLLEFAEKRNVDMIIMGSHGANGIREFFIGTNTQKIIRNANIPVLVVKNQVKPIRKIAIVSDFGEQMEDANHFVKQFTTTFKAEVHLAYVNTPFAFFDSRTILKRMASFAEEFQNVDIYKMHIHNDYQIESGIKHFCADHNIDLIVMGTHGKKGIDRLFSGSMAENVINHQQVPVLCLPISVPEPV